MTKIILFITLGLSTMLTANSYNGRHIDKQHPQVKKHIQKKVERRELNRAEKRHMKKMDKNLSHKHAKKRHFKSHDEFKRMKRHRTKKAHRKADHRRMAKHFSSNKHSRNFRAEKRSSRYGNHYDHRNEYYNDSYDHYERHEYRDHRRKKNHKNRGYRHTRNSWLLAYRHERASFYDRHGYYYGYFNHRGYMFEGDFYRYDRYYTYRDRVRGKGLFEHRYYRPIVDRYYSHFNGRHSRKW